MNHKPMTALIALMAILTVATGAFARATLAGSDEPPYQTLAESHASLEVTDAASDHEATIAVAWHQVGAEMYRGYVRWSEDAGATFEPRRRLNPGGPAAFPNLAMCYQSLWAMSAIYREEGPQVAIDAFPLAGGTFVPERHFILDEARTGDIACGGRFVSLAWIDFSTSPSHARLRVLAIGHECDGCPTQWDFDLGAVDTNVQVTATDGTIQATTTNGGNVKIRRFLISRGHDGGVFFDRRPAVRLFHDRSVNGVELDADGPRVAMAYQHAGDVVLKISDDRGRTFGGPTTLIEACPHDGVAAAFAWRPALASSTLCRPSVIDGRDLRED